MIPSASETKEAIGNFLFELGCIGLEEGPEFIKGYFSCSHWDPNLASSLNTYLESIRNLGFSAGTPVFKGVPQEDWSFGWRKYFKPIPVGSHILIKPPWESWEGPEAIVVDIMPRMAFGTGTHATTQLCIALLENFLKAHETVMDIGTGSGILAIVAAKMAASEVLAMDIQWESIENAQENMKQNDVQEIVSLFCGSIDAVRPRSFDLIVANINRRTLATLLPEVKPYTHDNSHLILSGILVSEDSSMKTLLSSLGYGIVEKRTKGEWMGYGVKSKSLQ